MIPDRKEKATAGVFSAGFRLDEALDIAADIYHGVSGPTLWEEDAKLMMGFSLSFGPS